MPNLKSVRRSIAVLASLLATLAAQPAAAQITFGDGVNPAPGAPICPGGNAAIADGFSLVSTATAQVTRVSVRLSPAGAYRNIAKVEIRQGWVSPASPGTLFGSIGPQDDGPNIFLTAPGITVTPTVGQYQIVITPRVQSELASGSGGQALTISANVVSLGGSMARNGSDANSTAVIIDNAPDADVKVTNVTTPTATSATITWTPSWSTVVLRQLGGPVTDVLVDGSTYTPGTNLAGGARVVQVSTAATVADSGLTTNRAYFYKIFTRDNCNNYSNGFEVGPVVPGGMLGGEGSVVVGNEPVVGLLNPAPGAVSPGTAGVRVQARVFSPSEVALTNVQVEIDDGAAARVYVPLVKNAKYGGGAQSGVYEVTLTSTQLVAPKKYTLRVRATGAGTTVYSAPVGIAVASGKGDGNLLVRDNSTQICSDCHTVATHSSEATGNKYGSWYAGCRTCHTPHGTTNASLIAERIQPPAVAGQRPPAEVHFSTRTGSSGVSGAANPGAASFANTDASGPCQVCHTRTADAGGNPLFRADGTGTSHGGRETQNCASCHKHASGFKGSGCDGCHGDNTQTRTKNPLITGTVDADLIGSPPRHVDTGTYNAATTFFVTNGGVHLAHVNQAEYRTNALACADCHAGNTHDNDFVDLGWGLDATADGASVLPVAGATTSGWVGNPGCTNYCHGATLADGATPSKIAVKWNTPQPTFGCGSCHGYPPLTKHDGSAHSTSTTCTTCHPGYSNAGLTEPAKLTHMDRIPQGGGTSCFDCHGDSARTLLTGVETLDDRYKAAPPNPAGGVHLSHIYNGTVRRPLLCDDCHTPTPTSLGHSDTGIDFGFSVLAGGAGVTIPVGPNYTCSATYCHADSLAFTAAMKGAVTQPNWAPNAAAKACDGCHKSPPTDPVHLSLTSRSQTAATFCNECHNTTVNVDGTINLAGGQHVDGGFDLSGATCTSCHGNPPISAATLANAGNANGWGNHSQHSVTLTTRTAVYACTQCHPNQTLMTHANGGAPQMVWTSSLGPTTFWDDGLSTCATSYCHGNGGTGGNATAPLYNDGTASAFTSKAQSTWGGAAMTPNWTDATDAFKACTACHRSAPLLSATSPHPPDTTCSNCHPAGSTAATITAGSNAAAEHVDGQVDLLRTGCTACHGDPATDNLVTSANPLAAAPGYAVNSRDVAGATTGTEVGVHRAHLQNVNLRTAALTCNECHIVPATNGDVAHATGTGSTGARALIDMQTNGVAAEYGGATPTYASGTCSGVYCHGSTLATGGAAMNPTWNGPADTCASCHTDGGASHYANTTCSACHGSGTDGTSYYGVSALGTNKSLHINGTVDIRTDVSCTNCHGAAADVNDWVYQGGASPTASKINTGAEWTTYGHGNSAAAYAEFTGATDRCLYCHNGAVVHNTVTNPFRLRGVSAAGGATGAFNSGTNNGNGVCLNCHGTGAFGVDPDGAGGQPYISTVTLKIDSYHYGATDHTATQDGGSRCWDCHDPHGDGTNIKMIGAELVRDSTDAYSFVATRVAGVAFTANAAGTDYAGAATKVCNACHTTTAYFPQTGGNQTHQIGARCVACHLHDQGAIVDAFKGSTACNACHNAPPTGGEHAAHDATGAAVTSYTAVTNHATPTQYGFDCGMCHTAVIGNHMDDAGGTVADPYLVDIDFNWDAIVYTPGGTTANETHATSGLVFRTTNGSCSTTYCHDPQGAAYAGTAVTWVASAGLTCTGCHDDATSSTLPSAHVKHFTNYAYGCERCHANTVTNSTTLATGASQGKVQHVDNDKNDVKFDALPLDQTPGTFSGGAAGTCSNTYCHSNGQDRTAPFTSTSIAWNTTADVQCDSCHGGNASATAVTGVGPMSSNDHAMHVNQASYLGTNFECSECHNSTVSAGSDLAIGAGKFGSHVNGAVEISMINGGTWSGTSTKQCSSTYCHSDGTETPGNYTTMDWDLGTNLTNDCKQCHGKTGGAFVSTYGEPNYTERVTTSDDVRNSHSKHVSTTLATAQGQCVVCHEATVSGTGALVAAGPHLNGAVDAITQGAGKAIGTYNATGESCTTVTCHGNNVTAVNWGGPALGCRDCHGATTGAANEDDVDNFIFTNFTNAASKVDMDDWTVSGHGRTTAFGTQSGNAAPDLDRNVAAAVDGCAYCHTTTVGHGDNNNFFRLANVTNDGTLAGKVGVCMVCHGVGSSGYDPDGAAGVYIAKPAAKEISSAHYTGHTGNQGGQLCWDCHDPHGDKNSGTNALAYMIQKQPTLNHTSTYTATDWGIPTGTAAVVDFRRNRDGTDTWAQGDYIAPSTAFNGVCQVCHTLTSRGLSSGSTYAADLTHGTERCTNCHTHQQNALNAFEGAGECITCHAGQKGSTIVRRAIVTEFMSTWSHKRASGRTVTNADCAVCHMEANSPADPTQSGVHGDGYINLRDPDTGSNIRGAYWAGTNAGGYTSTTTYLTFSQFSRNLGNKTLEEAVRAIQINQCLKCHDANGAASTLARVPGAPNAGRPFNTSIAGAAYTGSGITAFGSAGNVTDVNASFSVANASYHPVLGKNNNWYSRFSRMAAPWNSTTRIGTSASNNSWGDLISCWDCHAPNGTASTVTLTATVTAHGGATTLRGSPAVSGTPAAGTNQVTLCILCHKSYDVFATGNHGTGSAFTTVTRTAKTPYVRYGCNMCHSSGYASAVPRPIRAEDSHGSNSLRVVAAAAPFWTTAGENRWQSAGTPIAFIRNRQLLGTHQPARVGATTYSPGCDMSASGVPSTCNQQDFNPYTPGGTY